MNQGPNATTPTTTEAKIQRTYAFVQFSRGESKAEFNCIDTHHAEVAMAALQMALEAGRAQGRAEARAKPNPELYCAVDEGSRFLTLETSRGTYQTIDLGHEENAKQAQETILAAYAYALASGARPAEPKPAPQPLAAVLKKPAVDTYATGVVLNFSGRTEHIVTNGVHASKAEDAQKIRDAIDQAFEAGAAAAGDALADLADAKAELAQAQQALAEATTKRSEALAAAQNTIAALRADVENFELSLSCIRDAVGIFPSSTAREIAEEIRAQKAKAAHDLRERETSLAAARNAGAEWERRARDAETTVDLIRAELGVHPTRTPKEVLDEMRERLAAGVTEDVNEAYAKARHGAEMRLLELVTLSCANVEGDADAALKYAQAFAALRGAE